MSSSDTALVVMARYPLPGQTKTRLARTFGAQRTAELYRAFLTDIGRRFAVGPWTLHWAYTPAEVEYAGFVHSLLPEKLRVPMACFAQRGADFGARLLHAFQETLARGYKRVVLIGSDTPHLSLECVEEARARLDETDVVLGPAEDGGYYLIAMRAPHDVFSGIPMSTDVVLHMTCALAEQQGLRTHLLTQLFDIDEEPDLLRLAALLNEKRALAPCTAEYLERSELLIALDEQRSSK